MAKVINVEEVIAEQVNDGAVLSVDNKFTNADGTQTKVRSMESTNDPLEEGDIIEIPKAYKVLQVKFSDAADAVAYPCTIVTVKSLDGSERAMRFFPNSLAKNITPIVDGKRQAKVKTTGTAAAKYQEFATVDEAMGYFAGKSLKVTKVTPFQVRDYTTKEIRDTRICQYDLA